MSQAALRSFTSDLMISSVELSHEKPGLLNSYSLPTSVPPRFPEADQTELDRQFPADWDTSDCHPLASMFTDWCGEDQVWVLSLGSSAAEGLKKPREPLGHPGEPRSNPARA